MRVNLLVAYRLMVCIKGLGGSANLTQLIRCTKSSATTVSRYVEVLKQRELIEEEPSRRERRFRLTRRGEDFVFLVGRALALLGEEV